MPALTLDLKPTIARDQASESPSLDVSMSVDQGLAATLQLDLNELVFPSGNFAQTLVSQVETLTVGEITPLRSIANDYLSTQVTVAAVVGDRIAEALEIITGMEQRNAQRDLELSWEQMLGLTTGLQDSPAVRPVKTQPSEYETQLQASLAA